MVPLTELDANKVKAVFDSCFGSARSRVRGVYALRQAPSACGRYSAAVLSGAKIIAAIEYWPILLPDQRQARLLGPLAVVSGWRGQGHAQRLLAQTLAQIDADAVIAGVLVSGRRDVYERFGFRRSLTVGLTLPPPTAPNVFMGRTCPQQLRLNRLSGSVRPDRQKPELSQTLGAVAWRA